MSLQLFRKSVPQVCNIHKNTDQAVNVRQNIKKVSKGVERRKPSKLTPLKENFADKYISSREFRIYDNTISSVKCRRLWKSKM